MIATLSAPLLAMEFMQQALELAAERRGFCAPNPAVGAVVVKQGEIIGAGHHFAWGERHAEVVAIAEAGAAAQGADLYVTLEPCCHHGKTPPCTDVVIQSGIKRVFYGMTDPNPQVGGNGAAKLQAAGVSCQFLSSAEINAFYQSYSYWWRCRLPWVTVKLALSLDGKIADSDGKPVMISGEACQRLTHEWRRQSDAILTTANTVLADDPQLNVRLRADIIKKPVYVLDRTLKLPTSIRLVNTSQRLTILYQADASVEALAKWCELGVRCEPIPKVDAGLDWHKILQIVGKDGIHDLWVEAGGRCLQSLWQQQRVDRLLIYIAPKILGMNALSAFDQNFQLMDSNNGSQLNWQQYGDDVVLTLQPKREG